MILYYQHFIPGCSSLAKPLFALTAGQRRKRGIKGDIKAGTYRKLKPTDWTLSIFYYYYFFYFFLHVLICIFVRSTVSV